MGSILAISICVALSADTKLQPYYATIITPTERAVYAPDEVIKIHAVCLTERPSEKPQVVIHFIKGGTEIHNSAIANVWSNENGDRYRIECDLSRKKPYKPGAYILRVDCIAGSEFVVSPSRMIIIREKSEVDKTSITTIETK